MTKEPPVGERVSLRGTITGLGYGTVEIELENGAFIVVDSIHAKPLRKAKSVKKLIEFIKRVEDAHPKDYDSSIHTSAKLAALAWNAKELLKEWEK